MSPLNVVVGKANSGKTGVAYAKLRACLEAGGSGVLLLPSIPDVRRAEDELSNEYPLGLRAATLDVYASQLWGLIGDGRRLVTPAQRQMLLSAVPSLSSHGPGLARVAERCVARLTEESGIRWRDTNTRSISQMAGSEQDLGNALLSYAQALGELGLLEPAEAMWLLAERDCPDDLLVVHRFTDFTQAQEAMLTSWSQRGTDVLWTLPWQQGSPATEVLDGLLGRLEALGAARTVLETEADFATVAELSSLSRSLFQAGASVTPTGAVRLLTAEGERAEAEAIAREIRRLENIDGIRAEQIAVVFRDPARHYRHLRQAFNEASIAADYDVNLPVQSTAFGHAALSLLGFGLSRAREDLVGYLSSGYCCVTADDAAALEARWRKRGIADESRLLRDLGAVSGRARRIAESAIACASGVVDCQRVPEWDRLLREVFRECAAVGAEGSFDLEEGARCLGAMSRVVSEICQSSAATVEARDLIRILREQRVPVGAVERPGHVQVGSVIRMRSRRFQAVVLGGLVADEFPAMNPEDMLPGGAVGHVLEAFGGSSRLPERAPLERLLFSQCVAAARARLTLSVSSTDAEGVDSQASAFLDELLDLYRDDDGVLLLEETHQPLVTVPGVDEGDGGERGELRALAYRQRATVARVRGAAFRLGEAPSSLESAGAHETLSRKDVFSASELEAYLACPYRWFLEKSLRPDVVDREFGAAEQGEFAHRLLAAFYRRLAAEGISRMSPSTLGLSKRVIAEAYDEVVSQIGPSAIGREEFERRETLGWALRIVEEDAEILQGFVPRYLEWEFMDEPIDIGGFLLRGRVDRIDADSNGVAVITDYKRTGGATAAEIEAKGKIQLPLYMAAVSSRLGLEIVGGLYRGLRQKGTRGLLQKGRIEDSGITRTDILEPEEFDAAMRKALELARGAAEGIRGARIPREPRTATSCAGCGAALGCSGRAG